MTYAKWFDDVADEIDLVARRGTPDYELFRRAWKAPWGRFFDAGLTADETIEGLLSEAAATE